MRIALLVGALTLGCGSDDAASTTTDAGNTDTAAPKVPDASCVRPGDKGNEKGIGTACTPLGKECAGFAGAPVCLADLGQDQWMCSRIGCTKDEDCGTDTTCFKDPKGSGCVPNRCLNKPDGGTDTGTETGGETGTDATTDAPSEGG